METKEIKINVPDGYEIDEKNSTFECIKFKKKEIISFRAKESAFISGFYIGELSRINYRTDVPFDSCNYNVFSTEKQAKSALAMAQISQIMANDKRFGGIVTDEEWNNTKYKYVIYRSCNKIVCNECLLHTYEFLAFHTKEQRDLFVYENEDLVKQYLMID